MKKLTKAMIARSRAYEGSPERLVKLMRRAAAGKSLTLCFLGGSITQGSLSSTRETCYAYLVYDWFVKRFPKADLTYVNAGIGGTTSQFGVTRLQENVTCARPDFCMVEFSVNDAANPFFKESYEGVIRRLWNYKTKPALLIMNNLFYDTGVNTQAEHNAIAEAYDIPCISVRDAVRPEIEAGRIVREDVSPDGLHPNDAGHQILAGLVTAYLEELCSRYVDCDNAAGTCLSDGNAGTTATRKSENRAAAAAEPAAPIVTIRPVTVNGMEHLHRIQYRSSAVECDGFKPDYAKKRGIWDLFRHGWKAGTVGNSIRLEFTGSELAIQYRKTINRPAPVAVAVIDGDEAHPVTLDANFDEDWGDSIHIDTLLYHGVRVNPKDILCGRVQFAEPTAAEAAREAELDRISQIVPEKLRHTVEIRITETHEDDRVPFYLVSFMVG